MALKIEHIIKPDLLSFGFCVSSASPYDKKLDNCIDEIIEWITMNIGEIGSDKWIIPRLNPLFVKELDVRFIMIYFLNEEDASSFKLAWM